MRARERARYEAQHPRSRELAAQAAEHWFQGVPMHWMLDWGTPFPLFVREAQGATLTDADGIAYADFCLGDTGSMFGHSPAPIAEVLQRQGARGRPMRERGRGRRRQAAGRALGLPFCKDSHGDNANRYVLRWAGISGATDPAFMAAITAV
jgi:glutamate-1-semialdehyde 2,1-aminomutase